MTTNYPESPTDFLETKYGTVRALWQDGRVFVTVASEEGQAHINDHRPALTYRGEEYIGSVHLNLGPAGFAPDLRYGKLSRRSNWSDAPPSYQAAMFAAIVDAVTTHYASVDPTCMDRGALASIGQELHGLERDMREAVAKVDFLRAEISKCEARMAEIMDDLDEPIAPRSTPVFAAVNEVETAAIGCPNCQARPGEPCTQPTDTGRVAVPWFHLSRELTPAAGAR